MTCTTLVPLLTTFHLLIVVLIMRAHHQPTLIFRMLSVWGANFQVCSLLILISILIDFYTLVEYFLVAAIVVLLPVLGVSYH